MKKADFGARIRRIEITNRASKKGWRQAIRVVLDDIALTDENLLELRQFSPCDNVLVTIEPAQSPANSGCEELLTPFVEFAEGGKGDDQGNVVKAWDF